MDNEKQVVEKIENKEEVLSNKKSNEDLNFKISSSRPEGSKKIKNILIVCFIIFIVLACLSSLKGCSSKGVNLSSSGISATDGVSSGVKKVYNSVVYISNYSSNKKSNSGTGFVYKKKSGKAYVLTNYHVVQNSDSLKVVLSNGKSVTGTYLGGDKYLDIAVISIPSRGSVKSVNLGKASKVPLGATVFTIGTPVGDEYQGTVTKGILSGRDRMVSVSLSGQRDDYVMKLLQTDAAMSPGNSGGPLCTSNGEVIGVNSMKFAENDIEGMAFAVAIEDIDDYLNTFESGSNIKRPYLGINMVNMSEKDTLRKNSLNTHANSSSNNGVVVVAVKGNTSSYGKLRRGDVITNVNGTGVSDIAHFRYEVFNHKIGDTISISFLRDGSSKTVKMTLTSNR